MSEWISVTDSFPSEGQIILVYSQDDGGVRHCKYETWTTYDHTYDKIPAKEIPKQFFCLITSGCGCCDGKVEPRHWMPLPEPPKEVL